MLSVAIDGPSGAGKSTVARAVAQKLNYIYVDTGALYRAVALYFVQHSITAEHLEMVEKSLSDIVVEIKFINHEQHVFLNREDVTDKIRTSQISMMASAISALPKVREFLLDLQRNIAKENNVIMDGRDIGTVVLPNANIKIFLTASIRERARRRYKELKQQETQITFEQVLEDIKKRDENDSNRAQAPLCQSDDAVLVDSTHLSFRKTVQRILKIIKSSSGEQDYQSIRFYNIGQVVCNIFFYLYYNIQVEGIENLPPVNTGFVMCSNHQSYLDPVLMGLKLKNRYLVFMAKDSLFHQPILAPIIKKLGAFPVKQNSKDRKAIELATSRVKQGRILALFPEGTRSLNGKLLRPKSGAIVIAAKTGADVVPVAIKYYGKHPRAKIRVSFGKPIKSTELHIEDGNSKSIKEATKMMWKRVTDLYEQKD